MKSIFWPASVFLLVFSLTAMSAEPEPMSTVPQPLIVVEDLGGVSALPYYRALNLQAPAQTGTKPNVVLPIPKTPRSRFSESDMLPVRSVKLTPGNVEPRVIRAPGLSPFFLVGDDQRSRAWLQARVDSLRELRAVGFVVNVNTMAALTSLRQSAPGLTLVPASGDDMARRLELHHYPVLITATGIEQ